jgi:hypothetical protein
MPMVSFHFLRERCARKACVAGRQGRPGASSSGARKPYRIKVIKFGALVSFSIGYNDSVVDVFSWEDDGETYGPVLNGGKIGFRQMTPLIAGYSDFRD